MQPPRAVVGLLIALFGAPWSMPASVVVAAETERNRARADAEADEPAAQVMVRPPGLNTGFVIRVNVDPQDKTERLLLLAPGGPLVIELAMTIDGQPFRAHRESLVDRVLKRCDKNGDGKVTWEEAVVTSYFARGQYAKLVGDKQALDRTVRPYDFKQDGLVGRPEARWMMAQIAGGPAFMLVSGAAYSRTRVLSVYELLDADADGILSADELAGAEKRLKSLDVDDNDVLQGTELYEVTTGGVIGFQGRAAAPGMRQPLAAVDGMLSQLGEGLDWDKLHQSLENRYGKDAPLTKDRWPRTAALFEKLDADENGSIDVAELPRLLKVNPHVAIAVNLGESGALPDGVTVTSLSDELGKPDDILTKTADRTVLKLGRLRLNIVAAGSKPAYSPDATVETMMARYDADRNGYLERKELAVEQAAYLRQAFVALDDDNDGKAYPEEIKKSYMRGWESQWRRVSAMMVKQESSVLAAIDANADGRLGAREMRFAAASLRSFDDDATGRLSADEVPEVMQFVVALGGSASLRRPSVPGRPGGPAGPPWFVRMDRNTDGDLSPREFLGSREQFRKLDVNGDGFIDPQEASAAGAIEG